MCGIAGFLDASARSPGPELAARVEAMTACLRHRGPDAGGVFCDARAGVALGHRRLAIVDLSEAGAQPMRSASGRFVLSYNGELYNFRALRGELERLGHAFRGRSDTEVLLAAAERWGVEEALDRARGMFAFALFDTDARVLTLARDRVGKKPLYYGWSRGVLLFGSELRALRRHPAFDAEIDRGALARFVEYGWIPQPLSIYRGVRQLPPGTRLSVSVADAPACVAPQAYWSARERAARAFEAPFRGSFEAAADRLEATLSEAVAARMVADVEVGALLSGGIDSATVVALMQRAASRPARTFTIGFREPRFDESAHAEAVARHLGTRHEALTLTARDSLDLVPALPQIYDEPFADVSQIPTALVARMAGDRVKVVLTGDGGDELFAGYSHYASCTARWRRLGPIPLPLRAAAGRLLGAAGRASFALARPADASRKLPGWRRAGARLERLASGLDARSAPELLARHFARCADPGDLVVGDARPATPLHDPGAWLADAAPLQAMRHLDFTSYLPDDILVKLDRASMAVGLEARCPLLDTEVVALAWSLPEPFLRDAEGGKRVLRAVLARHVPPALFARPKRGFGAPVGDWLRAELRPWAEALLDPARLRREGYLRPEGVETVWAQHQCGWRNHENLLWALLSFQAWLAEHHPPA